MAETNTVGTSRNRRIPGIARLERGTLWRWGGSEAIQSALQTSDDVFVPLGLGEQMVPILSFLLTFLTANMPLCQSNRPGSAQCHSLSDHHYPGSLDISGPPLSLQSCQKASLPRRRANRWFPTPQHPRFPTSPALPLFHPLNLLRPGCLKLLTFPSGAGEGRP